MFINEGEFDRFIIICGFDELKLTFYDIDAILRRICKYFPINGASQSEINAIEKNERKRLFPLT